MGPGAGRCGWRSAVAWGGVKVPDPGRGRGFPDRAARQPKREAACDGKHT